MKGTRRKGSDERGISKQSNHVCIDSQARGVTSHSCFKGKKRAFYNEKNVQSMLCEGLLLVVMLD